MSHEHQRYRIDQTITSADLKPRQSVLRIGSIQMTIRDAVNCLAFIGVILGSIAMIPPNKDMTPGGVPSRPTEPVPGSLEYQRKHCKGTIRSDGKSNFSCDEIRNKKHDEDPLLKGDSREIEKKNSRRKVRA